jgi:K+ transporter
MMNGVPAEASDKDPAGNGMRALILGAIGVVFGDIGTSSS